MGRPGAHGLLLLAVVVASLAIQLARAQEAPKSGAATGPVTGTDAATGIGTVAGTVIDKSTGDPIIEAGVEVVGTGKTVRTDLDGKYVIKLPPGTYQLRIFAPLYQGMRLQSVTVQANQVTKTNASLASAGKAGVEVVEVVAQAKKAAEATQLVKRQKADTVQDNISGETIKKTTDSDAAEVVTRAPAVTVKDDKFIFVRGLGERYSSALLNGSKLPSTDPEKRVVPLDLFPADFIDSLSIIKSFSPDLPGDFSGGLVDINLREFPDALQASLSESMNMSTSTTFKRFRTYRGGGTDFWGFGRSFRDLPNRFGDEPVAIATNQQAAFYANSLRNIWNVESEIAPPGGGFNASVGNSWGPFGLEIAGTYSNEFKTRRNQIERQFVNRAAADAPPQIEQEDNFRYDSSTFETRLGGLLTSAYKFGENSKVSVRALIDRNSANNVLEGDGVSTQTGPDVTNIETQLQYAEEELDYGQLAGEHHLASWLNLDWRTALSRTTQYIPDTRNTTYTQLLNQPPTFSNDATSGLRLFSELAEYLTDSEIDFTIPFKTWLPFTDVWNDLPASFKFGPAYTYRDRKAALRRLQYRPNAPLDLTLPPEELLNPHNIGEGLTFQETTEPRDSFTATEEIAAGYGMFELPIIRDQLRVIGGARFEYSLIRLEGANLNGTPLRIRKKNTNPLPAVSVVYSPRFDMNVRAAYGKTVSRPEFRELSPILYPEPRGLRSFVGNPDLVQSDIVNWELRWEWFYTPTELVSLGFFYKKIDLPIEQTVITIGSSSVNSFANSEVAKLKGFEFEGRKNFGFIKPYLQGLSFTVNAAYINAEVQSAPPGPFQVQTSSNRPLQGQSPFVVNAVAEYNNPDWVTARLLYGTSGPRITNVGAFGLPDITEIRRDQLDFVLLVPLQKALNLPLVAKFGVENILNDKYERLQGDALQQKYITGTKFILGISYSLG